MNLLIKLSLVFCLGLSLVSAHSYENEYMKWHDPVIKKELLYEVTSDVVLNWPTIPGQKDFSRDELVAWVKSKHEFVYPAQLKMNTPYVDFRLYLKQGGFVDMITQVYSQPADDGTLEYWVSVFDPLTSDWCVDKSCRFMVVKQTAGGERKLVKDSDIFFASYQGADNSDSLNLPLDSGRVANLLNSADFSNC